ncbi:MAG TPA: NAD(P)-binding domain-containing protein [Ktedonobacteraceae bacterium]|nr:NAD(P)-binding domain-containing protein [Ktedonobacteraceae bacterium]
MARKKPRPPLSTDLRDVVVVGAGPYGLSTTAHLRERGLNVAIFGKPLKLWREHMPDGMLLRSYWWATNLSEPHNKYQFTRYFEERNQEPPDPLSRETFIDYALWFQKQVVPDVDETYVASIEREARHFIVTLEDGRIVQSQAVVMAPGLAYYVYRAPAYDHLPAMLVSHTADHATFAPFAGKRVAVIGGGQSALETAALLHESGAEVDIIARRSVRWLAGDSMKDRTLIKRMRYPKAGIAPGWFNWGLEKLPYTFQQLPRATKDRLLLGRGQYGPAGSHWLKPRILGQVTLREQRQVEQINETDDGVSLTLSDNEIVKADHIILGTGYRVNINKLPMLAPSLLSEVQTYHDAPVLTNHFESNVSGLYFIGISSLSSCGPLFRFVVGTDAAARRVAGAASRQVVRTK